jgi:L-arabinokinase
VSHVSFENEPVEWIGIAPARLDVMGGIADYSGSLVLQMPLDLYTTVRIQKRTDGYVRISSGDRNAGFDLSQVLQKRGRIVIDRIWVNINGVQSETWARYVLGCLFILLDEYDFVFGGMDVQISSDIPEGSGISSSAALEIAVLVALKKAYSLDISDLDLIKYGQLAENQVVGARCGIMDQAASYLGRKDALLPILCQPCSVDQVIPLPEDLCFIGVDTRVKHSVGGKAYGLARLASEMGLGIIQSHLGQVNHLHDEPWSALQYLAEISPQELRTTWKSHLPQSMRGQQFMEEYPFFGELCSRIDPGESYPVLAAVSHPIYENDRIATALGILSDYDQLEEEQRIQAKYALGDIMNASHKGYGEVGLGAKETDFVHDEIQKLREQGYCYGSRITGGGAGGTVCLLCEKRYKDRVKAQLKSSYEREYGQSAGFFEESGEGARYLSA